MRIYQDSDRVWRLCLVVVLIAPIFYSLLDWQQAFSGDWIVQDDARQHVFWMMRYIDPELFPDDLIANYFQSVAPFGYSFLYKLAAYFGIDPLVFNKLVPFGLRTISTYYFFLLCREIFPIPAGCIVSTLLFNHNIWLKDDIVSGTPRAFLYPFFLAFLYYLSKQALIPCCVAIILLSLFYPQMVLIAIGMLILMLIKWRGWIPNVVNNSKSRFSLICLTVAIVVLLPYAIQTSDYAPVITRAEAIEMAEFHYNGRSNFFKDSIVEYIVGRGNGVMISTAVFSPIILLSGLFLPLILKRSRQFELAAKITAKLDTLSKLLIASLGMYILAHIFLFRLHLPSRYTTHSLRITMAISAGITITITLNYLLTEFDKKYSFIKSKILSSLLVAAILLLTYSNFLDFYSPTGYKVGEYPELYRFFQQQPKDIVIASLSKEADNLPTFTERSVLVSREYAIPYQLGYYRPFSTKVKDLITAQYSDRLSTVRQFIRQYNISYWLIEDESFDLEYVEKNRWLKQYEAEHRQAISILKSDRTPVIQVRIDDCQILTEGKYKVINARCLLNLKS